MSATRTVADLMTELMKFPPEFISLASHTFNDVDPSFEVSVIVCEDVDNHIVVREDKS